MPAYPPTERRWPAYLLKGAIALLILGGLIYLSPEILDIFSGDIVIRARVSRVKSDSRTASTAILAYEKATSELPIPDPAGLPAWRTRLPTSLTTPVAYMTTLFRDPFAPKEPVTESILHFGAQTQTTPSTPDHEFQYAQYTLRLGAKAPARWHLLSLGPDKTLEPFNLAVPYDPTNGTISAGEIVRFDPITHDAR